MKAHIQDADTASGRSWYCPWSRRHILCVHPRYNPSFGTFHYAYPLMPGVKAFMPPLGMLLLAAYLPAKWEVRFIDENIRPAREADYRWADAVLIGGMHVQREEIDLINRAAHHFGKVTALGGPSVTSCPDYYPDVDILHLGEIGEGTDALIAHLDATIARPDRQIVLRSEKTLAPEQLPSPAYNLVDLRRYFVTSARFSSGCPHRCEFCDVPALFGRVPRFRRPEQVTADLDLLLASGCRGPIYFVDDDFIANRKATEELLEHLIRWQREKGYPFEFIAEATLTLARHEDILEAMREAGFTLVFCGIESPEPEALRAVGKLHNLRRPLLDAVQTINSYGIEIAGGMILGFDTDTSQTVDRVIEFVDASKIPLLTVNVLFALPHTPLYERLRSEGRLIEDGSRASNVVFRMPYQEVIDGWRRCLAHIYSPENLISRFLYQTEHTYPNRSRRNARPTLAQAAFGVRMLGRVMMQVGLRSDYAAQFRRAAWPLLRAGKIDDVLHLAVTGRHLIQFARDCISGNARPCYYADPGKSSGPSARV